MNEQGIIIGYRNKIKKLEIIIKKLINKESLTEEEKKLIENIK